MAETFVCEKIVIMFFAKFLLFVYFGLLIGRFLLLVYLCSNLCVNILVRLMVWLLTVML